MDVSSVPLPILLGIFACNAVFLYDIYLRAERNRTLWFIIWFVFGVFGYIAFRLLPKTWENPDTPAQQ